MMSLPRVSALAALALLMIGSASPAAFAQPAERPPYVAFRLPDDWAYVVAINDARHIVGHDAEGHPYLWNVDDLTAVALPDLPWQAIDINNHDQVLFAGYVWDAGVLTPLRSRPGAAQAYVQGVAMNDRGQIVGYGFDEVGWQQPLLWESAASVPQPLPLPDGAQTGAPKGLNEAGQISEWLREHAWKAILAMLTEEYDNISSRNRFNNLRTADTR